MKAVALFPTTCWLISDGFAAHYDIDRKAQSIRARASKILSLKGIQAAVKPWGIHRFRLPPTGARLMFPGRAERGVDIVKYESPMNAPAICLFNAVRNVYSSLEWVYPPGPESGIRQNPMYQYSENINTEFQ